MAQQHWRDSLICLPPDDRPTQGFMGAGGVPGFQRQQRTPDRQNFKAMSTRSRFSDGAFTGVTAIKSLHLDNNKLKSLPKSLELGTITNLTISNNPWSCTCQLAPLRRWMDSSRNRPDAVCASPPSQKGKQVRDSPAFSGCRVKARRAKKGTRH